VGLVRGHADEVRTALARVRSDATTQREGERARNEVALLLGLAVVALPPSSVQFSPRLLRNVLRDRPNQVVLSVFVGTFGYSGAGRSTVGAAGGRGRWAGPVGSASLRTPSSNAAVVASSNPPSGLSDDLYRKGRHRAGQDSPRDPIRTEPADVAGNLTAAHRESH
jgi:hypothetical protein